MKRYIRYYFKLIRYRMFNNIPLYSLRDYLRTERQIIIYNNKLEKLKVFDLSDMD